MPINWNGNSASVSAMKTNAIDMTRIMKSLR
jgi:hypothetical protein